MRGRYAVYSELNDATEGDELAGYVIEAALCAADAVKTAAEIFGDNNDGQEWMRNGCTLYSVGPDGTILKHVVGAPDFDPVFFAADGVAP